MIETVPLVIIFFYAFALSPYLGKLLSNHTNEILGESKYGYHILGILLIIFLVAYFGKTTNMIATLSYSVIIYFWFMLSLKMESKWLLIILAGVYFIVIYSINYKNKLENVKDDAERNKIIKKMHRRIGIMIAMLVGATLFGWYKYLKNTVLQNRQIGGGMDILNYFIE